MKSRHAPSLASVNVIHDSNDPCALEVTRSCRHAMGPKTKLLIFDRVMSGIAKIARSAATIRDHNKKSPGGVPGLFANQASHRMN
jgi:hypothetical protein